MSVSMANILANVTVTVVYILIVTFWLITTYRLKAKVKDLARRVDDLEYLLYTSQHFLSDEEYDVINGDSDQ